METVADDPVARYVWLCLLLCRRGDYDAAIEYSARAIELQPESHWAYTVRGLAWCQKEEYARAVDDLNEAIRLCPTLAVAHLLRASACFGLAISSRQSTKRTRQSG